MNGRIIGIRHRVKKTAEDKSKPTEVVIFNGSEVIKYNLEDDSSELDFLLGRFPIAYKSVTGETDLTDYREHQIKWRSLRVGEKLDSFEENRKRELNGKIQVISKVPASFDGLGKGDSVAMTLGGSGDRFSAALSRRGEEIDVKVYRVPPFVLKENRKRTKEDDALNLAELFRDYPDYFYLMRPHDRDIVRVKVAFELRQDAMKDRIACSQRIRQRYIGRVFLSEEGKYPEGNIEDEIIETKANDRILNALIDEEKERGKELKKAVQALDVWDMLFKDIPGCGERIAAGIIASVGDIRRFGTVAKFKAFAGVHVMSGGEKHKDVHSSKTFPRRRQGQLANWNALMRQSLYLLSEQFNRRPNSEWGIKLREYKVKLREKHPHVLCKACDVKWEDCNSQSSHTRIYSNGHIHKMALWRTITKFTEWLYREWTRIEREQLRSKKAA